MFEPVTIKQVLDEDGVFSHLELHQGNNVIELSLAIKSLNSQNQLYKWPVLRDTIEGLKVSSYGRYELESNPDE